MMNLLGTLARPFLFAFDPEKAHGLSIAALKHMPPVDCGLHDPRLVTQAMGLTILQYRNNIRIYLTFHSYGTMLTNSSEK